jgi:23S rRNA (uracil1939-C5)-methyltransferase
MMTSRRRSRLPAETFPAHVETLAQDGRGVAHVNGKVVFIHGALPGEDVSFKLTARHRGYDEGYAEQIVNPSPYRVQPGCPHFNVCGGCSLQYLDPDKQIAAKQDWLLENLSRIGKVKPEEVLEALRGPHWRYRRRARLGVKEVIRKGRVLVGFRERSSSYLADLHTCKVLDPKVGGLLEKLAQLVASLSIRNRLPQIEVAAGDVAVALSFRALTPPSAEDLAKLTAFGQCHNLWIYLQLTSSESTRSLWPEEAKLSYRLPVQELELEFQPYHFIQINAELNRKMVERVIALLDLTGDEAILDLFCGIGNFTLPLSRYARSVTGVEGEQSAVKWAEHNAALNGIQNVRFFAADLLADVAKQPWIQQDYDIILLDPPRSGAFTIIPKLVALRPRQIIYLSCHPTTLARDAKELVHRFGYRLLKAGVLDMFPHTAHVESLALFERK